MRLIRIVVSDPVRGLLVYPVQLAISLKQQGHRVLALGFDASEQKKGLRDALRSAGIPFERVDCLSHAGWRGLIAALKDSALRQRSWSEDVFLISFGPVSAMQAVLLYGPLRRCMCLVEAMGHGSRSPLPAMLGVVLLKIANATAGALCESEKRRITSAGLSADNVRVVYNPLNFQEIDRCSAKQALCASRAGGKYLIGYFANFQRRKQHQLLLRSFSRLIRSGVDVKLVLCGEGEERANVVELIRELGIDEKVNILGRLPYAECIKQMEQTDVVVHCSNAETFGYSMVEPLWLGRRCVFLRTGIASELENNTHCRVLDNDDCEYWAQAILEECKSGAIDIATLMRTRKFLHEMFNVDAVAERILQIEDDHACI